MKQTKQGSIIVPAILLLLLITVFGIVLLQTAQINVQTGINDKDARQAYYSAKSLCDGAVNILVNESVAGHTNFDASVEGMGAGNSLAITNVTMGDLPGTGSGNVYCSVYDKSDATVYKQTVVVTGTAEYNGYIRSVSRQVEIVRPQSGGADLAFYSVEDEEDGEYVIQGKIIGDIVIHEARSVTFNGYAVEIDGNIYIDTKHFGRITHGTKLGVNNKEVVLQASSGQIDFSNPTYTGSIYAKSNSIKFDWGNNDVTSFNFSSTNTNYFSTNNGNITYVGDSVWPPSVFGGTRPNGSSHSIVNAKIKEYKKKGYMPEDILEFPKNAKTMAGGSNITITENTKITSNGWETVSPGSVINIDASAQDISLYIPNVSGFSCTVNVTGSNTVNIYFDGSVNVEAGCTINRNGGSAPVNIIGGYTKANNDTQVCLTSNAGIVEANLICAKGTVRIDSGSELRGSTAGRALVLNVNSVLNLKDGMAWGDLSGAFDWDDADFPRPGNGGGGGGAKPNPTYTLGNYIK